MNKLLIHLSILCAAAPILTGCVSPRAYSRVSKNFPQVPAGDGRIYFYRGNDFVGGGQWDIVQLNGTLAGYVSPISFFYMDESPGSYTVTALPKGMFGKAIGAHQLNFTLNTGETKYICLQQKLTGSGAAIGEVTAGFLGAVGGGASPIPTLEDQVSAMKVLPKCLYYKGRYHVF